MGGGWHRRGTDAFAAEFPAASRPCSGAGEISRVGEIQTTLGRALRVMLQGVTISGNFTGQLQAGSGRRLSDQAENRDFTI